MVRSTPWFERRFSFDLPISMFPATIERLRGTPARIEDRIRSLSRATLVRCDNEKWSVQENIGHLFDLETLWHERLDDFMRGQQTLRPADLENRKTHDANHNATPIQELLTSFRTSRIQFVKRLEELDEAAVLQSALHPRLNQSMRLLDMVFFIAEHDDHHLARISELI